MSKLSKWVKKGEKWISDHVPHEHSADRRAANQAVAEQIEYYKTAKDTLEKETTRADEERTIEKKKISEKQIKSARRAYRAPGFLDEAGGGLSDTLG